MNLTEIVFNDNLLIKIRSKEVIRVVETLGWQDVG